MLENTYQQELIEAGCDEAGRGCLAGSVFAAAVILPENCEIEGLNDSKKISEKKRESLFDVIKDIYTKLGCIVSNLDIINNILSKYGLDLTNRAEDLNSDIFFENDYS